MTTLVITRPQPEADHWVQQLAAHAQPAIAFPLMDIGPSTSPSAQQALQHALRQLPSYHALMFVSSNAVRGFAQALQQAQHTLPAHLRLWAPGPGTAQTLRQWTASHQIDQPTHDAFQFDSESLWAVVQTQVQPGQRVLIVRGSDARSGSDAAQGQGRAWLSEQLQAHGVQVDFAPAYERHPPTLTPTWQTQLEQLHARDDVHWLFSSSDCIRHLQECAPTLSWQRHCALATHPRIAAQAQKAGFGCVIDTKPSLAAVAASLKSLA